MREPKPLFTVQPMSQLGLPLKADFVVVVGMLRARLGRIFEIADNEKPPAGSFSIQTR